MSLAQFVASITIPTVSANGGTAPGVMLPFSIARATSGSPTDRTYVELEELTTPGVDGRRWRQVRHYFPNFGIDTWADFASFSDAVTSCRNYWLAQSQFVTLYWRGSDFQASYYQVKVIDVQTQTMAGVLNGYGAQTSSNAIIHANWTLALQAIEGAQPQ